MSQSEPTDLDPDATTAAESYGDYSVEGDVEDELDRGYSPPEKYSPAQGYGNTPYEEATGESLDQRIAQEEPEPDPYAEVPTENLDDGEVGDERAGRLVDPEKDLVGDDVGIDGAAASAEEAAVHVVRDE